MSPTPPPEKKPVLWIVLGSVALLLVSAFVLRGFWHPYKMPTSSMAPALPAGGYVFVNDWAYRSADQIKRGDVIVFEAPSSPMIQHKGGNPSYVFRVVGLPGDAISWDDQGRFSIDETPLERMERGGKVFERQSGKWYEVAVGNCRVTGEVKLKEEEFFVAGDNRLNALDSRYWGVLSYDSVKGKARVD